MHEKKAKELSEAVSMVMSQPEDLKSVRPIVNWFGGGDLIEGWNRIKSWKNNLKDGKSPEQILNGLPQVEKGYYLRRDVNVDVLSTLKCVSEKKTVTKLSHCPTEKPKKTPRNPK